MMTIELQNIIIIILCSLSVVYLLFHWFKKRKAKQACANCPAMKLTQKSSHK